MENKEWQIKFSFGVQYYQILMKYEDEVDLAFRMLQVIYIRRKLTAWVLYFGVVVASYSMESYGKYPVGKRKNQPYPVLFLFPWNF